MGIKKNSGASAVAVLMLAWALSGCGGGAGGSAATEPPTTSTTPDTSDRQTPLVLSTANVVTSSRLALGYGETVLGIAQLALDWAAAADAAPASTDTVQCPTGGSRSVTLIDRDNNGRVSSGDQLSVSVTGCHLKLLDDAFSGTLAIDIVAPPAGVQMAGTVTFGPQFGLASGGVTIRIEGGLRFEYSVDRLSKVVRAFSSTQGFAITGSAGGKSLGDLITQLDARREVRRDTARASVNMRYHVASDILGGSMDVTTTTPWSAWFDNYPDVGELTLTSPTSPGAQLRASSSGDGLFSVTLGGTLADTVRGEGSYLWSGTGWVTQNADSLGFITRPVSDRDFRALVLPSTSTFQPNTGPLFWAYSRPLATGTVTGAKLVRVESAPGQRWVPAEVPVALIVDGALITVTPSLQLEPGDTYLLTIDSTSYRTVFAEGSLARADLDPLLIKVANTITADARIEAPGSVLGGSATLALNASASMAAGGPVAATHWRQVSGPPLSLTGAETSRVVVTPAGTGNGEAVVEVEVRNTAGEIDRQQLRFTVLSDVSNALIIGYRIGDAAMTYLTSADAATGSSSVKFHSPSNSLDVMLNGVRLLAGLPSGKMWQTGTEGNYITGVAGEVSAVWIPLYRDNCSGQRSGHLSVLDLAVDNTGGVSRLAIDFEETCSSTAATTFASVRYNSVLPLRQ